MDVGFRLILAFGSNLGSLEQNFIAALDYFHKVDGSFKVLTQSKWHLTAPFQSTVYDIQNQNDYLNFVCDVSTNTHPFEFYKNFIVYIENQLGHSRSQKWLPRALDVDILLSAHNVKEDFYECDPIVMQSFDFCVPHKELLNAERIVIKNMLENELNIPNECIKCHFRLAQHHAKK